MSQTRHVKAYVVPYCVDENGCFHVLGGISDKYAMSRIEIFGGGCAFGETPVENAQRELFEETAGTFRARLRHAKCFEHIIDEKAHITVFYFELTRAAMENLCANFPQARLFYLARGLDTYVEMRQLYIFPMSGMLPVDTGYAFDEQSALVLREVRKRLIAERSP